MSDLIAELKRRNVFRVAIAYALVGWVLQQIADVWFPALGLPGWTVSFVAGLLILGFPLVLVFSWAFELTPEGLKLERNVDRDQSITHLTGRKLDFVIIGVLLAALAWFAFDKFVLRLDGPAQLTQAGASSISIAVLPFVNMSADADNEYFSDGISEEMLNLLAKVPQLRVTGRTSSFQFKGRQEDLRVIGEQLGVANILEGSVRKSGNKVRVTAQLISASDGMHLWSESYDRELDDIFDVQNQIASSVVDTLKVRLLGGEMPRRNVTKLTEAYDLYLRGNYLLHSRSADALAQALPYFERALQLDPELASAWVGTASIHLNQSMAGLASRDQGLAVANSALERALALDPELADAHYSLGFIRMIADWDWSGAQDAYERALAIEPNHPGSLSGMGLLKLALGYPDEAIDYQRRSLGVDPLRVATNVNMGFVLYRAGQSEEALAAFRRIGELGTLPVKQHYYLSITSLNLGDVDAALDEAMLEPQDEWRQAALTLVYHAMGRDDESRAALDDLKTRFPASAAASIAVAHAYRGESDDAFEWLERAVERRDPFVAFLKLDPLLANVADDPRYAALLARLHLADET